MFYFYFLTFILIKKSPNLAKSSLWIVGSLATSQNWEKIKIKIKKTQLIYALSTYILVIYSLTEITGIRNEH
jgi:hypothetical protein